jgi:hypothetical protein
MQAVSKETQKMRCWTLTCILRVQDRGFEAQTMVGKAQTMRGKAHRHPQVLPKEAQHTAFEPQMRKMRVKTRVLERIRQHTSAYISIRPHAGKTRALEPHYGQR